MSPVPLTHRAIQKIKVISVSFQVGQKGFKEHFFSVEWSFPICTETSAKVMIEIIQVKRIPL